MTRKNFNTKMGFGKGLRNEQKKKVESQHVGARGEGAEVYVPQRSAENSRSVLESSCLDDLITTINVRKEQWEEAYGGAEVLNGDEGDGCVLLDANAPLIEVEDKAAKSRELISIPRRPQWHEGMSVEELTQLESDAFIEWRRGLSQLASDGGFVMTPYERNLDFWRQLWRCMERSDLLVQVLDARDPDFYFCQDIQQYVAELGASKRLMLLVNKADYLSIEQRQQWAEHFEARGVDAVFFSALNEIKKQEEEVYFSALAERNKISEEAAQDVPEVPSEAGVQRSVFNEVSGDPEVSVAELAPGSAAKLDAVESVCGVNIPVPDSSDDELAQNEAGEKAEAEDSEDDGAAGTHCRKLDNSDDGVLDVARLLDALRARLPKQESAREKLGVVGFVGYPNVGKSTVINALVGAKKVGMSRTPGKTKHIQTLELPEFGFTLCDAPGLVFPSVVATKAHLVINNTVPLDDLQECFGPIRLIVEKIGFAEVLRRYKCTAFVKDAAARSGDHVLDNTHSFLSALAVCRHHLLRVGVPDENWAARKVLRDYVSGKLLHCELPPGVSAATEPAKTEEVDEEDEFEDLNDMVDDNCSTMDQTKMTKKKERHLLKQLSKGVAGASFKTGPASGAGVGRRRENARAKTLG